MPQKPAKIKHSYIVQEQQYFDGQHELNTALRRSARNATDAD